MAVEGLCSGVTVMAVEVEGGAEAIGRIGWGGSTAAREVGVEVMGSGAMGSGGEDVCGAEGVAVSSARETRTVEMTRLASMGAGGGAEDVTTARVATSNTGVGAGDSVVAETTSVVSVVAGGGVETAAVDASEVAAAAAICRA